MKNKVYFLIFLKSAMSDFKNIILFLKFFMFFLLPVDKLSKTNTLKFFN